jgi:serine/threonine protein kinase
MKKIPKDIIKEENILNQLIRELKIQMFLDHPNIIKLYGFFHDKEAIYLLLELGSSGQLYKVIKERERMSESSTSYTIKQVCEAVRYLHFFKIIHRDLKPENIVIQSVQHEFTQGTVKLCDFGWAVCRGTELRSTFCGTPLYVSPEILKGQLYDEKIDLWAIGILTYELLFGTIPFEINREEELVKIVRPPLTADQRGDRLPAEHPSLRRSQRLCFTNSEKEPR